MVAIFLVISVVILLLTGWDPFLLVFSGVLGLIIATVMLSKVAPSELGQINNANTIGFRMLVVRQATDEPNIAISTGAFISWIGNQVVGLSRAIAGPITRIKCVIPSWLQPPLALAFVVVALAGAWIALEGFPRLQYYPRPDCADRLGEFAAGSALIISGLVLNAAFQMKKDWHSEILLVLVCFVAAPVLLPVYLLASVAVGIDSLRLQNMFTIASEAAPLGLTSVLVSLEDRRPSESLLQVNAIMKNRWTLAHSSYDNPDLVSSLMDWIRNLPSPSANRVLKNPSNDHRDAVS